MRPDYEPGSRITQNGRDYYVDCGGALRPIAKNEAYRKSRSAKIKAKIKAGEL